MEFYYVRKQHAKKSNAVISPSSRRMVGILLRHIRQPGTLETLCGRRIKDPAGDEGPLCKTCLTRLTNLENQYLLKGGSLD